MLRADIRVGLRDFVLDVALEVGEGECLALAGPSGAGKTTVLRAVAGLVRPDEGRIECAGATWLDTSSRTDVPPEERRCGYLFQEHALFAHLSAWQNVAYPLRELPRAERKPRAIALLDRFGAAGLAEARPGALSGGERQRVALARALARDPAALLLDEPLSALDARTRASASRELGALLREAGVPAVLVTHDFAEAAMLGDRVGVIDRGRVVQIGAAAELASAPRSAFVADFTGAVVLTGLARAGASGTTVVALDGGGESVSIDAATGRVAVCMFPWDLALEPVDADSAGSAQNRLEATVTSVTVIGSRVRVGLTASQPLTAEVTAQAVASLALEPGDRVAVAWKASATRLITV